MPLKGKKAMNYTDNQLKVALAKMLPDDLMIVNKLTHPIIPMLYWKGKKIEWEGEPVKDTELLHLCWLVEETINSTTLLRYDYIGCLSVDIEGDWEYGFTHASWQHRVIALAKVKGIEI